jgi:hypothetical protein
MMCHRAIEAGGFGNMPRSVRRQRSTLKSERTANPPSPALYAARDRKMIGMLTDGRGGQQGNAAAGFLTKNHQNDRQNVIF